MNENLEKLYQAANMIERDGEKMSHGDLLSATKTVLSILLPMAQLFDDLEKVAARAKEVL